VETLENRGYRSPLTKEEADLRERLVAILKQLKGPGADLSKRVNTLLSTSNLLASTGGPVYIPNSAKVDERSVTDLLETLQQQTEAIAKLGNVLKRDIRDLEIIQSNDTDMAEDSVGGRALKI